MITDEFAIALIKQAAKNIDSSFSEVELDPLGIECVREIIALAQEVRPLVFVQNSYGVLIAETCFGHYHIRALEYSVTCFHVDGYKMTEIDVHGNSEALAIAAAQADFNRRVLENLAHGESK